MAIQTRKRASADVPTSPGRATLFITPDAKTALKDENGMVTILPVSRAVPVAGAANAQIITHNLNITQENYFLKMEAYLGKAESSDYDYTWLDNNRITLVSLVDPATITLVFTAIAY